MGDTLTKYDGWLQEDGPAALVIREHYMGVVGPDGVIFPPTFAPDQKGPFKGGYNIDDLGNGAGNVCIIDTVGAQGNRIEQLFKQDEYKDLVPQIIIKAGSKRVNLLDAGHRLADAIARCSELREEIEAAFEAAQEGNDEPIARRGPTSLTGGVWDSRGSQESRPRVIESTIRAYNVHRLTSASQYKPPVEYVREGLLDEPESKQVEKAYSSRGFGHVPKTGKPGGVVAEGGVRRDVVLHLAALRLLRAGDDAEKTKTLQRYILGLALVELTYSPSGFLRSGCNLVLDPETPGRREVVYFGRAREPLELTHEEALAYARTAAKAFGVEPNREVFFETKHSDMEIREELKKKEEEEKKEKKGKKESQDEEQDQA
jgi:CRISPR-associated protein Csb1